MRNQNKPSNFSKRSESPLNKPRINLDFKVFIKERYLTKGGHCSYQNLDQLIKQSGCDDIYIDEKQNLPDLSGKVLVIKSTSFDSKVEAFQSLMRKLEDNEAMLFIPQSLVSMVIGTKGRTINSIKRDVGCEIFVN